MPEVRFTDLGPDIDGDSFESRRQMDRPIPRTAEEITDQYWLQLHDRGVSIRQIAAMAEKSKSTVFDGIRRARRREYQDLPRLTPLNGTIGLSKYSKCTHKKIRKGSRFVCLEQCGESGIDHYAALRRDPNDPLIAQRRRSKLASGKKTQDKLTRKQRRAATA